jgi:hypothetical protein
VARNRLDFGQPPHSAGGAGVVSPAAATAKGPNVGPTLAHPAPLETFLPSPVLRPTLILIFE